MSIIPKWFSMYGPKELLKYIQSDNMKILAIGCKYDDWLFRFFWFLLRGSINNLSTGQVAVEFTKDDQKLKNYLEQQNVKLFPDARAFMNEAAKKINNTLKVETLPRKSDGIFISYANEDKNVALQLFHKLNARGYNVWIDEKMTFKSDKHNDNQFDIRITNAINSCKIFMPILSSQVKADLERDKTSRYYIKEEWSQAQLRYDSDKHINSNNKEKRNPAPIPQSQIKIQPVVIGRYDIRSKYHRKIFPCIKDATAYQSVTNSIDVLYDLINKLLNNGSLNH